jgi:hypothetical protein
LYDFHLKALLDDKRKFPLGKNPDMAELQKFVKIASQLGYVIDANFVELENKAEKGV